MWEFLIRKHGNAVVLLKVINRVVLDAETGFLRKYYMGAFYTDKKPGFFGIDA